MLNLTKATIKYYLAVHVIHYKILCLRTEQLAKLQMVTFCLKGSDK